MKDKYSKPELKRLLTKRFDEFREGLLSEMDIEVAGPDEEQVYSADLAVAKYPGKWKSAKEEAKILLKEKEGVEYWLLVRRLFIQMGGAYNRGSGWSVR